MFRPAATSRLGTEMEPLPPGVGFLREHRQRDAADAALAGVAQGERHAHVDRISAAAHGGRGAAPFVAGQRHRRIVREIDLVRQILLRRTLRTELAERQRTRSQQQR